MITTQIDKFVEHWNTFGSLEGRLQQLHNLDDRNFDIANIHSVSFTGCDSHSFLTYLDAINDRMRIEIFAINSCDLEIENYVIRANHIVINENVRIIIKEDNLLDVRKLTFTDLKSFNGIFLEDICSVENLVMWEDKNQLEKLIYKFPNINSLFLTKSNVVELFLSRFKNLSTVELNYCRKLTNVDFYSLPAVKFLIQKCPLIQVPDSAPNLSRRK